MSSDLDGTDLHTVLRALGAPARREILDLIWEQDRPAGEIAGAFALTPATISEHLRVLREAGLVEMTRVGTSRRYRARPEALAGLHRAFQTARHAKDDIAGPLRIVGPRSTFVPVLQPVLEEFCRLHPQVQPDVQLVIRPGGTRSTRSALAPGLRLAVSR